MTMEKKLGKFLAAAKMDGIKTTIHNGEARSQFAKLIMTGVFLIAVGAGLQMKPEFSKELRTEQTVKSAFVDPVLLSLDDYCAENCQKEKFIEKFGLIREIGVFDNLVVYRTNNKSANTGTLAIKGEEDPSIYISDGLIQQIKDYAGEPSIQVGMTIFFLGRESGRVNASDDNQAAKDAMGVMALVNRGASLDSALLIAEKSLVHANHLKIVSSETTATADELESLMTVRLQNLYAWGIQAQLQQSNTNNQKEYI